MSPTNKQGKLELLSQYGPWEAEMNNFNICVLTSLLAPKTPKHFISIIFVHSVAVTCFSTPPEMDSPRDEMIGGRLAEPNVFPWYTIIFQKIELCYFYLLSFCVSGRWPFVNTKKLKGVTSAAEPLSSLAFTLLPLTTVLCWTTAMRTGVQNLTLKEVI